MAENKTISLQEYAMRYGTFLGLYWIFKFIFLPLGVANAACQFLFLLLTMFGPVLGFIYTRRFRNVYCGGYISFFQAFRFTFFMYLFATILVAAAHYIYFRFIDNGYLLNTYIQLLEQLKPQLQAEAGIQADKFIEAFNLIASLSPLQLTFQLITQNLFYGVLFALPTALLLMRRRRVKFNF